MAEIPNFETFLPILIVQIVKILNSTECKDSQ